MKGDCNICVNGKLPPDSAICVDCGLSRKNYKPMTKADRIRAMTDVELAGVFWKLLNESIFVCPFETPNDLLDWLKSPVEVDE